MMPRSDHTTGEFFRRDTLGADRASLEPTRQLSACETDAATEPSEPSEATQDSDFDFFRARSQCVPRPGELLENLYGGRCPRLGNYLLLELLGRGGMGEVYRGLHLSLRKQVAIKLLPEDGTLDPDARERFEGEIRIIGVLQHPNIVRLENACQWEGMPYLVMEYVSGLDLGRVIAAVGPVPFADACQMAGQAAQGLSLIHQQGLVHRDIKPRNLLLSPQAAVKISDLGVSRFVRELRGMTSSGSMVGDPHFAAPEQIEGGAIDERTDLYGLGCTLHALLTGRAPFADAGDEPKEILDAHLHRRLPRLKGFCGDAPPGLQKVLDRMTARRPADRFRDAAQTLSALAPFAAGCDLTALLKNVSVAPAGSVTSGATTVDTADYLRRVTTASPTPALAWARQAMAATAVILGLLVAGWILWPGSRFSFSTTVDPHASSGGSGNSGASTSDMVDRSPQESEITGQSASWETAPENRLLAAIDPQRDAVRAEVQVGAETITLESLDAHGLLQLPVVPEATYTLQLTVERLAGDQWFGVGLPAAGGRLLAAVDLVSPSGYVSGVAHDNDNDNDNGKETLQIANRIGGRMLNPSIPIRIEIDVAPGTVCLKMEDRLGALNGATAAPRWITSCWRGEPRQPATRPYEALAAEAISLHADQSSFRIRDLKIVTPDEAPPRLRFDEQVSIARSLAEGILWRGGAVRIADDGRQRTVERFSELPPEPVIVGIGARSGTWAFIPGDRLIAQLGELPRLRTLDLKGAEVSDEGMRKVGELPQLELLWLKGRDLSSESLTQLHLPRLSRIYLNNMAFGDRDLPVLARYPGLEWICLSGCPVSDAGVASIAGEFRQLRHLCLNATRVNGDVIRQLAGFPVLAELQLAGTRVDDDDIDSIASIVSLQSVVLKQSGVTDSGLSRLRELRPELEVKE